MSLNFCGGSEIKLLVLREIEKCKLLHKSLFASLIYEGVMKLLGFFLESMGYVLQFCQKNVNIHNIPEMVPFARKDQTFQGSFGG